MKWRTTSPIYVSGEEARMTMSLSGTVSRTLQMPSMMARTRLMMATSFEEQQATSSFIIVGHLM